MAPTQECIYYKRDGYCAKGQYCTFLHVTTKKAVAVQNKGPPTRSSSKSAILPTPKVTSVSKSQNPADDLWNHCDDIANSSDYCGFASQQNVNRTMRYSTVTRLNIHDDSSYNNDSSHNNTNITSATSSDNTKRTICRFYQLGSCRFGSFCQNSHDNSSDNNNNGAKNPISDESSIENLNNQLSSSKISATDEAELRIYECGICMENPMVTKSKSFGILSNCDCVFCLDCIRNWRRDGLAVAKKTEQVRRCPLCTVETYFICPSPRHVTGSAKTLLTDAYKESLSKKECKYFAESPSSAPSCPFGSSCFYRHVSRDGVVHDKSERHDRKLFSADKDHYTVDGGVKIFHFLEER